MVHFLIAALTCLLSPSAFAQSIERLTYEGRLEKDDGEPVESANVPFRLEIRSEAPEQCLLYRWETTKDMTNSGGDFTIVIGDASSGTASGIHSLTDIFSKSFLTVNPSDCQVAVGSVGNGPRRLHVLAKIDGATWTGFGSVPITHAPRAWRADRLGEFSEADLLKVNAPAGLTQPSLEQLFSVLKATPGRSATWDGSGFIAYDPKDGANLTTNTVPDAAISGVAWSKITGAPSTLVQLGGLSCSSGDVAKFNGSAWTCAVDATGGGGGGTLSTLNGDSAANQTLAVSTTGAAVGWTTSSGTHTLQIPFAATSGVSAGLLSNVEYGKFTSAASAVENAAATGAANTLVKRDGSGEASFGAVTLQNGVGSVTHRTSGAVGVTAYSWPHAPTVPGHVLRSGTDGVLFWSALNLGDMKNSMGQSQLPAASCASSQALSWSSLTDSFACADLAVTGGSLRTKTGMTFFVRTDGDDTLCNGASSAASPGSPAGNCAFATLQRALDALPEQISRDVTINVDGTFPVSDTIVLGKKGNFASGRKLSIESTGSAAIFEASTSGVSGFVVLPTMQNLQFKNVLFRNFTGQGPLMDAAALRVDGGLVLLDSVTFENNRTAVEVNHAGRVYFRAEFGPFQNRVTCSGEADCTGISVRNGEIGSMENANLLFQTSSSHQTLLRLERASADFSSDMEFQVSSNDSSAIRAEGGSSFRAERGLLIALTNSNSRGVEVSSSRFEFSGPQFKIQNWAGNAMPFSLENGGRANFRGPVEITGSSSSPAVSIRKQSALTINANFQVSGSSWGGLLSAEEQSSISFENHMGGATSWEFNGSGSDSAITLDSQSLMTLRSNYNHSLYVNSPAKFVRSAGGSRFIARYQDADFSGTDHLLVQSDATSTASVDSGFAADRFDLSGGTGAAGSFTIGQASWNGSLYEISNLPTLTNPRLDEVFQFRVAATNSFGGESLRMNAVTAQMVDAANGLPIPNGFLVSGKTYKASYDGSVFRVTTPGPTVSRITVSTGGASLMGGGETSIPIPFTGSMATSISCNPQTELNSPNLVYYAYFSSGNWRLRITNTNVMAAATIPSDFNCAIVD